MRAIYVAQVGIWRDGGKYVFDRKFYDGMLQYSQLWPGKLHCVAWETTGPRPDFGLVAKSGGELPFSVALLKPGQELSFEDVESAALVIGSADDNRQLALPQLCKNTPYLLDMEHTPQIRADLNRLEVRNPLRRFVRQRRMLRGEGKRLGVIQAAAGMAANGLAAFEHYSPAAKAALLYFDTRATRAMQISDTELENKEREIMQGAPLQLVFSGRLVAIKGIGALAKVAKLLSRENIPFRLTVYGSGELEASLKKAAESNSSIRAMGSVDFASELMPALKAKHHLFVCCHRQGDPSCTYLETFAAGVPMAGFANASLAPLAKLSGAADVVPMDFVASLADLIAGLHFDRPRLAAMCRAAAEFSKAHTFEGEFASRVAFWRKIAKAPF